MIHLIIRIVIALLVSVLMLFCSNKMLQIYQMSSYRTKEVFAWFKSQKFDYVGRYFSLAFFSFAAMFIFIACFGKYEYIEYLGVIFFAALMLVFFFVTKRQIKVPVKFTGRMKRFTVVLFLLFGITSYPLIYLSAIDSFLPSYTLVGILPLFIPLLTALAAAIVLPVETLINGSYKRKAAKKLAAMPSLIKIGITGSFGKTTAKNILAAMLKKKYEVCASPQSYNTPMGLTRVINNDLNDKHEVFIAEMGARYTGDIKELTDFIKPKIGIITGIGNMHLETFRTPENLLYTKLELADAIPESGFIVLAGDSAELLRYAESSERTVLIPGSSLSMVKCSYDDVRFSPEGTSFEMVLDGQKYNMTTKLLGNHIPQLICQCALAAYKLGVPGEEIAEACGGLNQVPHRLELIQNGDTTVIDDAYNSNPAGAKNALEVLKQMGGVKIIITPGMVELGDISKQAHLELGENIAGAADYAILIGRNAPVMKEGALGAGMDPDKIFTAVALKEAMEILEKLPAGRRTVLFENDLPDNY